MNEEETKSDKRRKIALATDACKAFFPVAEVTPQTIISQRCQLIRGHEGPHKRTLVVQGIYRVTMVAQELEVQT